MDCSGEKFSRLSSVHIGCQCQSPDVRRVHARLGTAIARRELLSGMAFAAAALGAFPTVARAAAPAAADEPVLLTNLRLFDGHTAALRSGVSVLVQSNKITSIIPAGQSVAAARRTIDCGSRIVMPGLIDAHWHTMLCAIPLPTALSADLNYIQLIAAEEAGKTLMRGYTSVRDVGGPAFSLKRAIDEGRLPGPRIYPSGAPISQTAGHGDFRNTYEVPQTPLSALSRADQVGAGMIADGVDEVRRRTREQLMLGACQIKLMAGGGVASLYDHLDVSQYSEEEIRAAVGAAEDWNTYVTVHVYTSRGIQRAIRAGVRCIEHGQLADAETAKMIADRGVWWSLQPFLVDEDANKYPDAERTAKLDEVSRGTELAYGYAKKYGIKTAWGTDILFNPAGTATHNNHLAKMTRFYTPFQVLKMATSDNAELLALSGPRNPYPAKLGVIEPGAYADLLVVDGDLSSDLSSLRDPEKNIRLIMKDGRIFKNTLV